MPISPVSLGPRTDLTDLPHVACHHLLPVTSIHNCQISTPPLDRAVVSAVPARRGHNAPEAGEAKVDSLYECVAEAKRFPHCLEGGAGNKFIRVETDTGLSYVPCKKVFLPSGRMIYTGVLGSRRILSDGELYHIEYTPHYKPPTFAAALLGLVAHLTQVYACGAAGMAAKTSTVPRSAGTRPTAISPKCDTRCFQPYSGSSPGWLSRLQLGLKNLPFPFPAVAAEEPSHLDMPDRHMLNKFWPEEIITTLEDLLEPNEANKGSFVSNWELYPLTEDVSGIPVPINYHVDMQNQTLDIANIHALQLCQRMENIFKLINTQPHFSLSRLLAFDHFIGDRIAEIFKKKLYLKNRKEAAEIFLLKTKLENMITHFIQSDQASIHTKVEGNKGLNNKNIIINFFPHMIDKMIALAEAIDMNIICEAVSSRNGMHFKRAMEHHIQLYIDGNDEDKHKYLQYIKIIFIMEQARKIYLGQLNLEDSHSPFKKAIYINDRDFFMYMLDPDITRLEIITLQRIFIYIFDYNRKNGISVHDSYFIIPGELTRYRDMFLDDLRYVESIRVYHSFITEINSYITNNGDNNLYLSRLINIIELFRKKNQAQLTTTPWNVTNLTPYQQASDALMNNINTALAVKSKVSAISLWRFDFNQQVHQEEKMFIMMVNLMSLQNAFNERLQTYHDRGIKINEHTEELRVAMAKVEAVKIVQPAGIQLSDNNGLLRIYTEQIEHGNIQLYLDAAIYWFFSQEQYTVHTLSNINVLNVLRKFNSEENLIAMDFLRRDSESYTSIYDAKRSEEIGNLEDYYNQFIEYKNHDIYHEARSKTINAIFGIPLDYIDIISYPKRVFIFKLYSRNYVQNTLVDDVWVSLPKNNYGYLAIIETRSRRLKLVSTLANSPLIRDITNIADNHLINRLLSQWQNTSSTLALSSVKKYEITKNELLILFSGDENLIEINDPIMDLLLTEPEENIISNPMPEFSISAVKKIPSERSFIHHIDHLNQETLIEIADNFRESLLDMNFINYITLNIPFFNLIWRHWHDADHEITVKDVIFDLVDVLIAIFPVGITLSKLNHTTLNIILNAAKAQKVPRHLLRKYIVQEFVLSFPSISFRTSATLVERLVGLLNPFPLSEFILKKFCNHFTEISLKSVHALNEKITLAKIRRQWLRSEWKININPHMLAENRNGLHTSMSTSDISKFFIHDHGDFFQVRWDPTASLWRVINPHNTVDINYAIPVKQRKGGHWTVQRASSEVRYSELNELAFNMKEDYSALEVIKFESLPKFAMTFYPDKDVSQLHKKALRFFVEEQNAYIQELLNTYYSPAITLERIADRLTDSNKLPVTFGKDTYTAEQDSQIKIITKLMSNSEIKISFRSMILWTDQINQDPLYHQVIVLDINGVIFIIDLLPLRLLSNLRINDEQVFTELDWLLLYRQALPKVLSLVKYKDFHSLDEAILFPHQEGSRADKYVENAFLLKEPSWYRAMSLNPFNIYRSNHYPLFNFGRLGLRRAVSNSIAKFSRRLPAPLFAVRVLRDADMLTAQTERNLSGVIGNATQPGTGQVEYLDNAVRIIDFDELLQVEKGKLLAITDNTMKLEYLAVGLGNGWFAGAGNSFFDIAYGDEPTIMVAEEMCRVDHGVFKIKGAKSGLHILLAGNAIGASQPTHVLNIEAALEQYPFGPADLEPAAPEQRSRQEILLGKSWELIDTWRDETFINIRGHGVPFANDDWDPIALAHAIRGLIETEDSIIRLGPLQSIRIHSCFAGLGDDLSLGQLVANELNMPVEIFPNKQTVAIFHRHPQWFRTFTPAGDSLDGRKEPAFYARQQGMLLRLGFRRAQIHDMLARAIDLHKAAIFYGDRHNAPMTASIYIDIANLLLRQKTITQFTHDYELTEHAQVNLTSVVDEYIFDVGNSAEVFIQAILDIIYSVESLKYLASRWQ